MTQFRGLVNEVVVWMWGVVSTDYEDTFDRQLFLQIVKTAVIGNTHTRATV